MRRLRRFRKEYAPNPGLDPALQTFRGVVKQVPDDNTGYGFVSSPEMQQKFGRDASDASVLRWRVEEDPETTSIVAQALLPVLLGVPAGLRARTAAELYTPVRRRGSGECTRCRLFRQVLRM